MASTLTGCCPLSHVHAEREQSNVGFPAEEVIARCSPTEIEVVGAPISQSGTPDLRTVSAFRHMLQISRGRTILIALAKLCQWTRIWRGGCRQMWVDHSRFRCVLPA